ncbi:MAG: DNA-binding beta-propeller fold protein YncE [Planctomycetota bacterium]|jgi:DNA-binding beta-propeller fold protein YncE
MRLSAPCTVLSLSLLCTLALAQGGTGPEFDNLKGRWVNYATGPIQPSLYSEDGQYIYNINQPGARLQVLDAETLERVTEVPVGHGLVSIGKRPGSVEEMWCVDQVTSVIGVINLNTMVLERSIPVSAEPHGIAFDAEGTRAYVTSSAGNCVDVIDATTYSVVKSIDLPVVTPRAIVRVGDTLWVAPLLSGNGTAPRGNPDTGRIDDVSSVELVSAIPGANPLPDRDLLAISITASAATDSFDPSRTVRGLGTILFNLHHRPGTSELWVPHTEALNGKGTGEVSFPDGQVVRNRIAVVDANGVKAPVTIDLDNLITNSSRLVAEPTGIAFSSGGNRAYVFGYGSDSVGVFNVAGSILDGGRLEWLGTVRIRPVSEYPNGTGPRMGALSPDDGTLFVHNKAENSVSTIDVSLLPVDVPFFWQADRAEFIGRTPTPFVIREGRVAFISTQNSGSKTSSCNSCHIDGHTDGLAWELSLYADPEGTLPSELSFPLDEKGPLVTQTLRRIKEVGPYHWRGEKKSLKDFNGAFIGLLEREVDGELQDLGPHFQYVRQYMEHLAWLPNPNQRLDRTLTPLQQEGLNVFRNQPSLGTLACVDCHPMPLGTRGEIVEHGLGGHAATTTVPSLRGVSTKVGERFFIGELFGTRTEMGAGLMHGGHVPTIEDYLGHSLPAPATGTRFNLRQDQVQALRAYLDVFDTGMAPSTAVQVTADAVNADSSFEVVDTLMALAHSGHNDLVYRYGPVDFMGQQVYMSGYYDTRFGTFQQGSTTLPNLLKADLRAIAVGGVPVTFVGTPVMMGWQMGVDRDVDMVLDLDEVLLGTDIDDSDSDGDGYPDGYEVEWAMDPLAGGHGSPDNDSPSVIGPIDVIYRTTNAVKFEFHTSEVVRVLVGVDGQSIVLRKPLDNASYDHEFSIVVNELDDGTEHMIDLFLTDPSGNASEHHFLVRTESFALAKPVHISELESFLVRDIRSSSPRKLQVHVKLRQGDARPAAGYTLHASVYSLSLQGLQPVFLDVERALPAGSSVLDMSLNLPAMPGNGLLFFVVNSVEAPPGGAPWTKGNDVAPFIVTAY